MNNDFIMNTDEVKYSGEQQKGIAQNFNSAVQNIFSTIESICASEWKGFSSKTYADFSNVYREPMRQFGELISEHANNDINSANRTEDVDQELSSYMNKF